MSAPRAFISYSHDSPEHARNVRKLSQRLRADGIECEIDQYEMSPPEGWPAWMQRQIQHADFVLVVASKPYLDRVLGTERPGIGLGARWEGAIITNELYEQGGRNAKFIPVVFGADQVEFIPPFLRQYTRYDINAPESYGNLYRLLTQQPAVPKPPVGAIKQLARAAHEYESSAAPAHATDQSLVLISSREYGLRFIPSEDIHLSDTLTVKLKPQSPQDTAFLLKLRDTGPSVGVAYDLTALLARVERVEQRVSGGRQQFEVTLKPEESDYGAGFMEISTTHYSADDIAELRARRILLDERLPKDKELTLEALVSGLSARFEVAESPLPDLFTDLGDDPHLFLSAARLVSVLWLRLSGCVEFVLRLDLALNSKTSLTVGFEGQRARKYTNEEPHRMAFDGVCELRGSRSPAPPKGRRR